MEHNGLFDPILTKSALISPTKQVDILSQFHKKFKLSNFIVNILIPIVLIICILFILKYNRIRKNEKINSDYLYNTKK